MTTIQGELVDLIRRDRRRRSRRKVLSEFVVALVMLYVEALLTGWFLMLAIGVVHHEWIRSCPTIGYWWAALLSGLLRSGLGLRDGSRKAER